MENKRDRGTLSVYFAIAGVGLLLGLLLVLFGNIDSLTIPILAVALMAPLGIIGAALATQAINDPDVKDKALFILSRRINLVIFCIDFFIALYVKSQMSGGGFHM